VGWTLASPMESDKYKIEIMSAMELKEKELNEDKDDEKYESQKISLKSLQVEAGKSTAQINFQEVMPKMWPISLSWTFQCQARVVTQAAFSAWSQSKSLSIAISYSPTFTNLGATGRNGPTSLNTYYANQCHEKHVTLQNGIQMWTVPCTGKYKITAYGAKGGDNNYTTNASRRKHGGYGAKVGGTYQLSKNEVIQILVGQMGSDYNGNIEGSGGGGGGTFVMKNVDTPLLIAGGGNGACWYSFNRDGVNALAEQADSRTTNNGVGSNGRAGHGGSLKSSSALQPRSKYEKCLGQCIDKGGVGGEKHDNTYGSDGGFGGGWWILTRRLDRNLLEVFLFWFTFEHIFQQCLQK
ncbi:hypothetical protein RFI_39524, partial [Reticulomyxa filosa]